ncbi:MAG TPA: alpha/beta hydrolase [Acidimicrobiales bacterium]
MAGEVNGDGPDGPTRPLLPPGRAVELPGRGTTFVRELPGPIGAPTVVLLHGWTATADLNWFPSYSALSRRFRVMALDHRGHGQGIRSKKPFRLEDCADDAVALADVSGVDQFIPIGYSMGGPIAQLTWQRHPDRVLGMVLCATSRNFRGTREEKLGFFGLGSLAVAARVTPGFARSWITTQFLQRRGREYQDWAFQQIERHDWTTVLEAGRAIGGFSSRDWIREVDVPTAVLVTMRDMVVPVHRQIRLAESIPGALAYRIDGGHDACVAVAERFVPTLVAACTQVAERARRADSASQAGAGVGSA